MPAVFGSRSRTAQITSTLAVKYRNHWPSPIFPNIATCISAPASFVAPAIRNAAAASACKVQSVTLRAYDDCDSSDKATTELSDMRHFPFRVSLTAEHTQISFQAICAIAAQRRLLSSHGFSHNKAPLPDSAKSGA